jgi:transposase-like protein/ribosomal protein L37AE/L43A
MAEDYPRTLGEIENRFATEERCLDYLAQLRWPEGFVCPRCGGHAAWRMARGLFLCRHCRKQTSVTAGTVFQSTHLPITLWFRMMWLVTSQKDGASALGLQRVMGLGSYHTAWGLLHKLRRAMVRPGRDRLRGEVEVDETYWGAPEPDKPGRELGDKTLIIIAAQKDGKGIGRIRMRRIPNASAKSLHPFILDSIEPGATIHTDGWLGYEGLETKGYRQVVTPLRGNKRQAIQLMPRVHLVASLLKRWLISTHQGAISKKHLDYYLDEYTFRFNRRKSQSRGKLFYRLVQQTVQVSPQPYKSLVNIQRQVKTGVKTGEPQPVGVG